MKRYWPYLVALTLATPARGDDAESALGRVESLDLLLEAPLPGETESSAKRLPASFLIGKTVTRVTALNDQTGFNPVAEADIPLGVPLSAALTRAAVRRLWDTGNYSNIQIYAGPGPGDGVEILIDVEPMLRMRKLEVLGNDALDDEKVGKAVEYSPDRTILADPEVLRQLKMNLLSVYSAAGYREAHANLRIEATGEPGGVALVVEVEEGKPERYTQIRVPGLPEELDEGLFLRDVGLKDGMLRSREDVEKKVANFTQRLASAGYCDAKVNQFRERRLGRYDVELIVPVEPGIKSQIVFEGNVYFRTEDLEEALKGEGLLNTSPESIDAAVKRLKDHYRTNGFFHALIRTARICIGPGGKETRLSGQEACSPGAKYQVLKFDVADGPMVEVARIDFSGNKYFSAEDLETEIFAFVKEEMESEEVFQPLNTQTVDELGLSDKRPIGQERPRGAKSPTHKRSRVYVPKIYGQAMDHLVGVYQEQGFLDVRITDACDIAKRKSIEFRKMRLQPFEVFRPGDSDDEKDAGLKPCVFIDQDRDTMIVAVSIDEGPQTRLNEIAFEGNRVFPARTLQEIAGLSVTDPYNEYRLRESTKAIVDFYKSRGYMFASASFDKSFSEDMERAKVVLSIQEGPQVRIGNIRIEGAEMTSKRLIRERLTFRTGDVLTPDEIEESQQSIMELGILSSAVIQMVSPEVQSAVKNMKIQVTEAKPQYLELTGGIATIEGLRGGFEYGYRNLAGWAINARVRLRANYRLFFVGNESPVIAAFENYYEGLSEIDKIERHILAGVSQPHFPGTYGLLGWGIDGTIERLNEPAFSATRYTAFLRLNSTHAIGKIYRRAVAIEARVGVEDSTIDVLAIEGADAAEQDEFVNPTYQKYLLIPKGHSDFLVTGLKLTLDFRDSQFNPTKGMLLAIGGDFVRSLKGFAPDYFDENGAEIDVGDYNDGEGGYKVDKLSNLIRTEAAFSFYLPFGQTGMVLAVSFSGGYVFHLADNSTTWADRYFYAGGIDTLRGFAEESLVPEDLYQQWKASLQDSSDEASILLRSSGGEAMFIARAEFRYPLAKGFYGALFGEAGNLWRENSEMKNIVKLDPLTVHLRPVAGGGVRYITPLGPLSFDLGVNLMQRPHEEPFAWYFSIGTAF